MLKISILTVLFIHILHGGRYPGIVNIEDVLDATEVAGRIGACPGGLQGIVIAPRIIATVSHGELVNAARESYKTTKLNELIQSYRSANNQAEPNQQQVQQFTAQALGESLAITIANFQTNDPICINGQHRKIIRKVEEGGLGFRDLTLLFLDAALEGIEICPILKLTNVQSIPRNSGLHAFSLVSDNIILGKKFEPGASLDTPANDTLHALPYGLCIPHYGALNTMVLRHNFELLSVDNRGDNTQRFIPVGGDSGSPCFASTNTGDLATVGVVSTIDGRGASASYTYVGAHLDWINGIIAHHYAAENQDHFRIQTIDATACNFNPGNFALPTIEAKIEAAKILYEQEQQTRTKARIEHFNFLKAHIGNQIPPFCEVLKNLEKQNLEIFNNFQIQHFLNSRASHIEKISTLSNLEENINWLHAFSNLLQKAIDTEIKNEGLVDIAFILNDRFK